MKAPDWFIKELRAFDSDLRLRWSPRLELWQLERKVRRSLHPGTIRCDGWHDDYIRARDGYLLVASLPPNGFSKTVFEKLRNADLWSQGGWKKIADAVDAYEDQMEEEKWRKFSEEMRDYSKDVYNFLSLREGRTVYNAGWGQ